MLVDKTTFERKWLGKTSRSQSTHPRMQMVAAHTDSGLYSSLIKNQLLANDLPVAIPPGRHGVSDSQVTEKRLSRRDQKYKELRALEADAKIKTREAQLLRQENAGAKLAETLHTSDDTSRTLSHTSTNDASLTHRPNWSQALRVAKAIAKFRLSRTTRPSGPRPKRSPDVQGTQDIQEKSGLPTMMFSTAEETVIRILDTDAGRPSARGRSRSRSPCTEERSNSFLASLLDGRSARRSPSSVRSSCSSQSRSSPIGSSGPFVSAV